MRQVLKMRFYCDHCKKSGGSSHHMKNHEAHCTNNPNRECGVCDLLGGHAATLEELKAFALSHSVFHKNGEIEGRTMTAEDVKQLKELAAGCPACILAVLRQTGIYCEDFNFKEEMKFVWGPINEERMAIVGYGYC